MRLDLEYILNESSILGGIPMLPIMCIIITPMQGIAITANEYSFAVAANI